jgi:hypothetical protein
VAEAQRFIDTTGERYLDADLWAGIRGITLEEARLQLEAGVEMRLLEKCLLYEWPDAPVRFLVPPSQLGLKVRLSDIGYIGEDDEREVTVSANRVRTVFVSEQAGVR